MILFTDPLFLEHETGNHPESPRRLNSINARLRDLPAARSAQRGTIRIASRNELQLVHDPEYVRQLENVSLMGGGMLDSDTVMSPKSFEVASFAAGSACEAVQQVVSGQVKRAICLSRPPGHHALPSHAMGFCLFNHIAIAARCAQRIHGVERILIVDWDVHHGNGTQDVFYEDGQIFYFSIHRFPFYPGTGDADECGAGPGLGTTLNVPVPAGISRAVYFELFEKNLEQAVRRARPQLMLISAGFDAHRLDPIGSLGLETEDFGRLTDLVLNAADAEAGGRVVSLLEGGYHPQALADSVALHLERLADESVSRPSSP
jgi:acetoin utilization deacetylase AcuC-like enzyme